MAKLFLVFGTQGAGKTTVLTGVKSAKTVSIGTEMFNVYSRKFGIKDRDQVRKHELLDYGEAVKIRNTILKKIAARSGTVAIDTHASVKAGDGYIPGLSFEDFSVLKGKVKAIIYVDSDTRQILRRRKEDKTRKREADNAAEIDRHRGINTLFTTLYSLYLEAPIYMVRNEEGGLVAAQKRVDEIIRKTK